MAKWPRPKDPRPKAQTDLQLGLGFDWVRPTANYTKLGGGKK